MKRGIETQKQEHYSVPLSYLIYLCMQKLLNTFWNEIFCSGREFFLKFLAEVHTFSYICTYEVHIKFEYI